MVTNGLIITQDIVCVNDKKTSNCIGFLGVLYKGIFVIYYLYLLLIIG